MTMLLTRPHVAGRMMHEGRRLEEGVASEHGEQWNLWRNPNLNLKKIDIENPSNPSGMAVRKT
jgi:hypothetical protein